MMMWHIMYDDVTYETHNIVALRVGQLIRQPLLGHNPDTQTHRLTDTQTPYFLNAYPKP